MRSTRSRFVLLRVGALGAGAALLVLAACEAKVPTAADVASMDVASAQKSASEAGLMRTPASNTTDFFVNGVKVSAAEARAMEAKIIGSIEVVKSELPSGRDTIYVTTLDRMPKQHAPAAKVEAGSAESAQTLINKVQTNPGEKTVAHVENELEKVRVERLNATVPDGRQVMRVRTPMGSGDQPLFMIDGKQVSSEEFGAVRGEDIASINVYKGEAALRISSDPAAKNGVIMAKMKVKKQ